MRRSHIGLLAALAFVQAQGETVQAELHLGRAVPKREEPDFAPFFAKTAEDHSGPRRKKQGKDKSSRAFPLPKKGPR